MRSGSARAIIASAGPETSVETWPRGISRRATMRISDALAALRVEFPTMTPSRLRFLEDQGLVQPVRTPGGYRQYSPADVERLRYVLRQQRDHYRPLRVIAEQLAALDIGEIEETTPRAQLAASNGEVAHPQRLSLKALAASASVTVGYIEDLVDAGVLRPSSRGIFEAADVEVVVAASRLAAQGIDPRHLRLFRTAVDRQCDLIDQVVAPVRGQRSSNGPVVANGMAAELGELFVAMYAALLRSSVSSLL